MKYTYLLIDFFTVIIPLVFSFHPRLMFYKNWRPLFVSLSVTAAIYIVWDVIFTNAGVWGFSKRYTIGINIANLPLEELLFFFCIPYACVFTFDCLGLFIKPKHMQGKAKVATVFLAGSSAVIAGFAYPKLYTFFSFIVLAVLLLSAGFILKITWLKKFYIIYIILMPAFFIVNGLLTGSGLASPVVWYNNSETLGVRILTVPVEDVFYGMGLLLANVLIYEYAKTKKTTSRIFIKNNQKVVA